MRAETSPADKPTPGISVVVPFHNVEKYIGDCLAGLLDQSMPREDYEVILVDNNSTDRSAEIAAAFDRVVILREPVTGSYAARNKGITSSQAPVIATLDPDCRPDRDWLHQIAESMRDPKCNIVLGYIRHATGSRMLDLLEKYEAEKVAFITERQEAQLYFGYTSNMAFRRTVFDTVGLFPERIRGGDTILVRRAVDKLGCGIVRFNPQMRATHLEVDTVKAYYSKRHVYGNSNEHISHTTAFRPLTNGERWSVFRRLVKSHGFPLGKALLLLAILAPGFLFYETGRGRGMLNYLRFFR